MKESSRRVFLASSASVFQATGSLAQSSDSPEIEVVNSLNRLRPWLVDGTANVLAGALRQQLSGQQRAIDLANVAQALRMFALHGQEAGLFRSSERMFRASNRQLKTITASGLRRELRQTLILRRLSVPEREIDRMLVAFEARRDDAIELMMGHDLSNLRAFGTAARNLDIRARLLACRAPNRQYCIVPAFQQDVYEPDGGVPTFSVTVCGNCEQKIMATMALTAAMWTMAGIWCPVCAAGGAGIALLGALIAFLNE